MALARCSANALGYSSALRVLNSPLQAPESTACASPLYMHTAEPSPQRCDLHFLARDMHWVSPTPKHHKPVGFFQEVPKAHISHTMFMWHKLSLTPPERVFSWVLLHSARSSGKKKRSESRGFSSETGTSYFLHSWIIFTQLITVWFPLRRVASSCGQGVNKEHMDCRAQETSTWFVEWFWMSSQPTQAQAQVAQTRAGKCISYFLKIKTLPINVFEGLGQTQPTQPNRSPSHTQALWGNA